MSYQTWIPDVLRDAGFNVSTEPGWEKRGSVNFNPKCVIAHHTGSLRDVTTLLRDGRSGPDPVPGPLCNVEFRRSAECRVIAAGRANHAGRGGYRGLSGGTNVFGIEATSDGKSWTSAQRRGYPILCVALAQKLGVSKEWIIRHANWTERKWDAGAWETEDLRVGTIEEDWMTSDEAKDLLLDITRISDESRKMLVDINHETKVAIPERFARLEAGLVDGSNVTLMERVRQVLRLSRGPAGAEVRAIYERTGKSLESSSESSSEKVARHINEIETTNRPNGGTRDYNELEQTLRNQ